MRRRRNELPPSLFDLLATIRHHKGALVGCHVCGRGSRPVLGASSHLSSSKNKYLDWVKRTFVHVQCAFHPVGIIVLGIRYVEAKFRARDKGVFSIRSRDDAQQGRNVLLMSTRHPFVPIHFCYPSN
uniref:Uncharacterized protein n=1 Tax=Ixodes ricinus TaxID=34613 RepID=A0A6B0UPL9_IXORI